MAQSRFEPVALAQIGGKWLQDCEVQLDLTSTAKAYEVLVRFLVGEMVVRHTVVHVCVAHKPEIFQGLQGSIDGADVDVRKSANHKLGHTFRRYRKANTRHCLSDEPPLRCHAQSIPSKRLLERTRWRHRVCRDVRATRHG